MNQEKFRELILKDVSFEKDIVDLANFLKCEKTNITKLSLTSCKLAKASISALIQDCKNLNSL